MIQKPLKEAKRGRREIAAFPATQYDKIVEIINAINNINDRIAVTHPINTDGSVVISG